MQNHDDNQDEQDGGAALGEDEKVGQWSEGNDDDGGVLASEEDVGIWTDDVSVVEEGYQAGSQDGQPNDAGTESDAEDDFPSRR